VLNRKYLKPVFYGLVISAGLGFGAVKANAQSMDMVEVQSTDPESVQVVEVQPVQVVPVPADTNYCHYKFRSVITIEPGLHGSGGSDQVDYYGTCDRREARRDEIQNEWNQTAYQWETNYSS